MTPGHGGIRRMIGKEFSGHPMGAAFFGKYGDRGLCCLEPAGSHFGIQPESRSQSLFEAS